MYAVQVKGVCTRGTKNETIFTFVLVFLFVFFYMHRPKTHNLRIAYDWQLTFWVITVNVSPLKPNTFKLITSDIVDRFYFVNVASVNAVQVRKRWPYTGKPSDRAYQMAIEENATKSLLSIFPLCFSKTADIIGQIFVDIQRSLSSF